MNGRLLPFLPCDAILFRAVIYENLVRKSDGSHKPRTFIRRRENDPNGLSVSTTIDGCRRSLPAGIFGVRTIHVGTLRDHGFDVVMDSQTHGNLRLASGENTPRTQDNEPLANTLAEQLLNISRPVEYWNDPDADERCARELEQKRAAKRED